MKPALFRPLLLLLLTCSLRASAAGADDLSSYKTADALWEYMVKLGAENPPPATSQQEELQAVQTWLTRQRTAAMAFIEKFPEDVRRWDARLLSLLTAMQLEEVGGGEVNVPAALGEAEKILSTSGLSAGTKSEAAYVRVKLLVKVADSDKPETLPPLQKAITYFLDNHAESKRAREITGMQLTVLRLSKAPNAEEILRKLIESKNPVVAELAKQEIEQYEIIAKLKKTPFMLTFTAADGRAVDVSKMRGKVVLLDFWATWCPPCMAELPGLVTTYKKYHEKGFEIIGISSDEEKDDMDAVLKKLDVTWPQFFDGNGRQNRVSATYSISMLPTTWLFDKKGMLRETDLRGAEVAAAVEKLLAE